MNTYFDMASEPNRRGVVLFAHGARDPRWSEPLEAVAVRVRARLPEVEVAVAYLEVMQPDLGAAVDLLAAQGCREVAVIPVFLGLGGHVRRDLPERVDEVAARHPELELRLTAAAGEDPAVLDAIADFCARAAG